MAQAMVERLEIQCNSNAEEQAQEDAIDFEEVMEPSSSCSAQHLRFV